VNLFIEYFYYNNPERDFEIFETIEKNSKLSFIDNIYCVAPQNTLDYLKNKNLSEKLKYIAEENRCTFQYLFDYSNTINNSISCVLNNDIILSEDFINLKTSIKDNDFYCISRREYNSSFSVATAKWSQDVWCWKNKCKIKNCNFYFGVPGNDNTIPYHATQAGYDIKNPCLTFKCYHNHKSNYRIYKMEDRLDRQFYKEVIPCHV
jgi:hypothetical protein